MNTIPNPPPRSKGFTLVEVMVTMTIFGFVSIGLAAFIIEVNRGLFWSAQKSLITKDVRNFTTRISLETLGANTGYVYPGFNRADRDSVDDRRQSGQSGDCLVLIYMDPHPDIDDPKHYTRIVVYFRQPDAENVSPVYRAEKTFSTPREIDTSAGPDHFEDLLNAHFPPNPTGFPVVLELSRGLADGSLFRNFGNNTFVVNGEILHGNQVKEVTNTYNLTISPRG